MIGNQCMTVTIMLNFMKKPVVSNVKQTWGQRRFGGELQDNCIFNFNFN